MKRLFILLGFVLLTAGVYAQTYLPYGVVVGAKRASAITATSIITTIDSVGVDSEGNIYFFAGGDTLNPQNPVSYTENLSDLVPMLVDTIPLFTAGYGWGAATDTTGIDITADFGGWYNDGSDTVQLAKVIGIVKNSKNASSVTINVYWDANYYDATPDSAFTAGLAITSTTAGTSGTTFAKAKIPPHVWVWVKPCRSLGTTGTKPSKLRLSVSGYKIPKY